MLVLQIQLLKKSKIYYKINIKVKEYFPKILLRVKKWKPGRIKNLPFQNCG